MKTSTDYNAQAENLLVGMDVKFDAAHLDSKCPLFCDGKHVHGDRHLITFSRRGRKMSLHFWNSFHDMQLNKYPTAYDVLACITKNDPGTFEDFCSEFGYDTDSISASKTYEAVVKEWLKVSRFFTPTELEALQEVA